MKNETVMRAVVFWSICFVNVHSICEGIAALIAKRMHVVVLCAVALALGVGCGRTRTNTYEIEVSGPLEAERVRVQLDGREIAAFPGFESKIMLSRDEATPFPYAKPPLALKAEIFGPDGWTATPARIDLSRWPDSVERDLAAGIVVPLQIYVEQPEPNLPLYLYVDNRGQAQATRIALGHAERTVAAGQAAPLRFLRPTSDEGTVVRVDGVEIGRVRIQKASRPEDMEQLSWLADVSGKHAYRQRAVVFHDRRFANMDPYKKDEVTVLKSARFYQIPRDKIDYFLEPAPSSIAGPDLDLSYARIELLDAK